MSSTTDKIKGTANEVAGNVKEGVGKLTGDAKLQAEGKAQQVKGTVQYETGDTKDAVKDTVNKL